MSELTMKQRAVRAVLAAVDKGPKDDWPLDDFADSSGRKAIAMVNEDSIRVLNVSETVDIVLTAALGDEPMYRIDSSSNDWDELGAIDADGESLGVLVRVNPEKDVVLDEYEGGILDRALNRMEAFGECFGKKNSE